MVVGCIEDEVELEKSFNEIISEARTLSVISTKVTCITSIAMNKI